MIADMGHYGRQWHKVIMSVLVLCGFMVSPCVTLATPPEFPTLQPAIGANLPAITDYARTPVYADLMHQARRFGTAATPWDERALLGDDGWPVGDFGVFLMTGKLVLLVWPDGTRSRSLDRLRSSPSHLRRKWASHVTIPVKIAPR